MGRFAKKLALAAAVIWITALFTAVAMAADGQAVRDFPGWNGSGTKNKGLLREVYPLTAGMTTMTMMMVRGSTAIREAGVTALPAGGFSTVMAAGPLTAGSISMEDGTGLTLKAIC